MGPTSNGKQLTCMKITKLTMVGRLGAVINSLRIIGIVNEKYQKAVRFFEKKILGFAIQALLIFFVSSPEFAINLCLIWELSKYRFFQFLFCH